MGWICETDECFSNPIPCDDADCPPDTRKQRNCRLEPSPHCQSCTFDYEEKSLEARTLAVIKSIYEEVMAETSDARGVTRAFEIALERPDFLDLAAEIRGKG